MPARRRGRKRELAWNKYALAHERKCGKSDALAAFLLFIQQLLLSETCSGPKSCPRRQMKLEICVFLCPMPGLQKTYAQNHLRANQLANGSYQSNATSTCCSQKSPCVMRHINCTNREQTVAFQLSCSDADTCAIHTRCIDNIEFGVVFGNYRSSFAPTSCARMTHKLESACQHQSLLRERAHWRAGRSHG